MENNTQNTQNAATETNVATNNTENTESVQNTQSEKATDDNIKEWIDKLDKYFAKRQGGLAKSMLKDNGISDDDIKDILDQYNSNKAAKSKELDDELNKLKTENASLKKKIMDGDLLIAANKHAEKLNIDKKYISQVLKLADLSKATEGDKVNEDALNEAMAKVIEECGVFKINKNTTEANSGFKNIGAKESNDESEDSMSKIRKAMGLK
jgi:hypothetical protein